jgi:hypothetical protein
MRVSANSDQCTHISDHMLLAESQLLDDSALAAAVCGERLGESLVAHGRVKQLFAVRAQTHESMSDNKPLDAPDCRS